MKSDCIRLDYALTLTESETVNEIVQNMTGFDLDLVTKEQLHPNMRDRASSAVSFTPEPQEVKLTLNNYVQTFCSLRLIFYQHN